MRLGSLNPWSCSVGILNVLNPILDIKFRNSMELPGISEQEGSSEFQVAGFIAKTFEILNVSAHIIQS